MTGARAARRPGGRSTRTVLLGVLAGCAAVGLGVSLVLALFASSHSAAVVFTTKHIFPAERVTPAFAVSDVSSGTPVDGSSTSAFAGDSRA
jgi:hypothetical protein